MFTIDPTCTPWSLAVFKDSHIVITSCRYTPFITRAYSLDLDASTSTLLYAVDTGEFIYDSVATKQAFIGRTGPHLSKLEFTSTEFTSASRVVSSSSAKEIGATTCFENASYCVTVRDFESGARFDLNNYNDGIPDEYALVYRSNHVNYQENSNLIITVYWTPFNVQIFDSSKIDGSH